MMLETTETLKFLVALRPGLLSPTLAAQMAATFQWQSGGRLLLNVVTGGEDHEQRTFGDFLDKNQRYARCGEFLDVIRQLWSGNGPVDFSGEYVNVEKATLQRIPDPVPPIFFGGSSPAAGTVASRYADTYLTWGETRPLLPPRSPGFATSRKFKVVTSTTESVCMSSAGHLGTGMGRSGSAAQCARSGDRRAGSGESCAIRLRRSASDARIARRRFGLQGGRRSEVAGDCAEPVDRRRIGARGCRHRIGRFAPRSG